ncbi:MAG: diacylglycerol/lipid kinase family protein, partial [Bulleidia sp.]
TTSIGGMETPLLKDTKLDDGLFECLLIKAPNNLIDYNSIMADFNGRTSLSKNPFATVFQTRSVTFRAENPIAWTLDGEDGGTHQEAAVSVVPQGMKILVPEETQNH